jgi:putative ABC transport system substrate-binding protein
VIGYLRTGSQNTNPRDDAAFLQGLKEAGYIEGENLRIERAWAEGQYERLPALAADLVARHVAVIAAFGNVAARAAKAATASIPIVFVTGDDPVAVGLVPNLNQPGGNVTGVSMNAGTLPTKRLELLHEIIPTVQAIAMLINPRNANFKLDTAVVQHAAKSLGLQIEPVLNANSERDFDAVFTNLAQTRARALLINPDAVFSGRMDKLAALALRQGMASIYSSREYAESSGLMSYGSSRTDAYRQVGVYTGRVLKGDRPANLPVLQPTKFELVINLKTAKTLGIDVPLLLQQRADEVIE